MSHPSPRGFAAYVQLLRGNPDVRNIWLAQIVSQLGDWFNSVALLGLLNQLTRDPLIPSLVTVFTVLPSALASLSFGGYLADRFDRKKLAVATDLLRAVIALCPLLIRSADAVWIAFATIAAISLCESVFSPAIAAAQPNLCQPHELPTANALQQSTWAGMSMVGAFLGGVVAVTFGRDTAFVLNGVSFLLSAWFVLRVRGAFSAPGQRAGGVTFRALTDGLRYMLQHRLLLGISLAKSIWAFAFATVGLFSVYAFQIYGNNDQGTSLLYAARGIGSFLGPLLLQPLVAPKTPRAVAVILGVGLALGTLGYGVWAVSTSVWIGAVALLIAHLGGGNVWTFSRIFVQQHSPDHLRGRIMALDMVGFTLVTGVFAFVYGVIARESTPTAGALTGVAITGLLSLLWMAWASRRARN
jgi:predicted MFS family arabinose efflux permease